MKSNVNWKPMGHSAKRWQGMTQRKDSTATLRETRAPRKKGWAQVQMWSSRAPYARGGALIEQRRRARASQ
jgi:hypothetical protein